MFGTLRARCRLALLAALALTFTACGDGSPDAQTPDASELKLVGGTATNARPEVGRFRGCTATLFLQNYVISAAHCLNYPNYTDTTVRATDTFSGVGIGGGAFSYGVSRIYSFGRNRYEFTPGNTMTSDVIIVRLSSAVPVTVAVAAPLADVLPANGQTQTIFGYGCTDRNNTGGTGGNKQYFQFAYGNNTQALCPGDSGGPTVHGGLTGGGAIWGINSDYRGGGAFPTWNDLFGDVVGLKGRILSVIAQWEGGYAIPGVDIKGFDYHSFAVTPGNRFQCQQACLRDASCKAFTVADWNASTSTCYLKSRVQGWTPCNFCASGLPPAVEPATDRVGSDYRSFSVPANLADQCLSECARDATCRSYTFRHGIGGAAGYCWLKNAIPAGTAVQGLSSGSKRAREYQTDRPGGDYANFAASSETQCEARCATDERCRAYTWVGVQNRCWLKSGVAGPVVRANMVSAVKRGLEVNIDRPGLDYRSFEIAGERPELCQATCAAEAQCRAFTWVPAATNGNGRCWLKNGVPGTVSRSNMVSGVKGADFF